MWSYWAPGHSAILSTLAQETVPCQCPPASQPPRWRISSRDRANPGTGVGRHPTSEEHLDSPRGPGLGRPRTSSASPSPRDPPAASSSRPYALSSAADPTRLHSRWGGPTPATPRCSPSGDVNGVRLPGAATQLHPHCQVRRAQVPISISLNHLSAAQAGLCRSSSSVPQTGESTSTWCPMLCWRMFGPVSAIVCPHWTRRRRWSK